jgi:ATP-dependent Lhr-like helicase
LHEKIREQLARRGASFYRDLYHAVGGGDDEEVLDALWDLVWAGEVTNDTFAPLRVLGPPLRRSPRRHLTRLGPPRAAGRWSLVQSLREPATATTERLYALAATLLERHGVLTREATVAEGVPGGFAALYPVLRAMEESGKIRRGYFIEGLGGSQFALPGAVDRLRSTREPDGKVVAMAATDPANPYGAALPWPPSSGRMARAAGAHVVLESGELRLYLERGGRSLFTAGTVTLPQLEALTATCAAAGKLEIQRVDGEPVHGSALDPLLRAAGFGATPKGLALWPVPSAASR